MIDIKLFRENKKLFEESLKKRNADLSILEELQASDDKFVALRNEFEANRSKQNSKSKLFGEYKRDGKNTDELSKELEELKSRNLELTPMLAEAELELNEVASKIPNILADDVPNGKDEDDNLEIKRVLSKREFDFEPKDHADLAEKNGYIDFKRGVKISKSRFAIFINMGARLERALINYMMDFNAKAGYSEVLAPCIVNKDSLYATGQLPKFSDDLFKISGKETEMADDEEQKGHELYLLPTSEVSIVNMFRDEIITENELPLKFTSYSPCFRREAGNASRDTKGIIRQHQFDKVEIVSITKEEDSVKIHEEMVEHVSSLLASLGLHHRLVKLCGGDTGFGANSTIDLEVWIPSQNKYREISSVSNTLDFQARRGKIRYKGSDKKNRFAHTLNGSSLAVGRTLVAIMENYQKADGSIEIPKVLHKYMDF